MVNESKVDALYFFNHEKYNTFWAFPGHAAYIYFRIKNIYSVIVIRESFAYSVGLKHNNSHIAPLGAIYFFAMD
jgi:hypothetical protein